MEAPGVMGCLEYREDGIAGGHPGDELRKAVHEMRLPAGSGVFLSKKSS
jgi:hypothetical protein